MNLAQIPLIFDKDHRHRILLLITCFVVIVLGIFAYMVPPCIDPDACYGFLVMHGLETGQPFNTIASPDPHHILTNRYEFLAWWSPGQYLVPYFFKVLLKINTGHAVVLTITICNLLGITGFYKLFTRVGFSKWLSAISVAFIACQLFFFIAFTYFGGGEVILFAFLGWFLYGCFGITNINWQAIVFVFLGGLLGFICKSSVLWMYATSVACIWVNISLHQNVDSPVLAATGKLRQKAIWVWLKNGLLLAIPLICAIALIYIFYLSKGDNPTSDQGPMLVLPETFGFPLASPILSAFSVDELVHGLLYQTDGPTVPYYLAIIILTICSACCITYLFFAGKLAADRKYPILIIGFYLVGTLFFSYMYLKQATISYEGRHFRMIGLLFMPGFIYLLFKTKITRVLFLMMWIGYLYLGITGFRNAVSANQFAARSTSGLSETLYEQSVFNEINKIDDGHHNDAIFVVTSSDIAMEITHCRVITLDADMNESLYALLNYQGKAGPVYIITPNSYIKNGRLAIIQNSFKGYHHFTSKPISPNYLMTWAKD